MKNNYSKRKPKTASGKRDGKSRIDKGIRSRRTESNSEKSFKPHKPAYKKAPLKAAPSIPKNIPKKKGLSDDMRLNRFIANSGVCSKLRPFVISEVGVIEY